jgi:hypothetical protein
MFKKTNPLAYICQQLATYRRDQLTMIVKLSEKETAIILAPSKITKINLLL